METGRQLPVFSFSVLLFLTVIVMRVIIYVDGLNLFYSVLKGTVHKWLDLAKLFKTIRNDDDVISVRYFTAPFDGSRGENQKAYLTAISSTPDVRVELGHFQSEKQTCGVPRPHCVSEMRDFYTTKEKQTDVGVAVAMVEDAARDNMDAAVIVSGDSDLVPAVRAVQRFDKRTILYVPHREAKLGNFAMEIRQASGNYRQLPTGLFRLCQLPDVIETERGPVQKPADW